MEQVNQRISVGSFRKEMQHARLQARDDIKREKKKSKFHDRLTFILKNHCRCLLTNLLTWTWTLDRKLWGMLSIYLSAIPAFWETRILIGWRHGWWWERCAAWLEEGSGWRHDDVHGWSGGSQRQSPPPRPSHRKKLPPPRPRIPIGPKKHLCLLPRRIDIPLDKVTTIELLLLPPLIFLQIG